MKYLFVLVTIFMATYSQYTLACLEQDQVKICPKDIIVTSTHKAAIVLGTNLYNGKVSYQELSKDGNGYIGVDDYKNIYILNLCMQGICPYDEIVTSTRKKAIVIGVNVFNDQVAYQEKNTSDNYYNGHIGVDYYSNIYITNKCLDFDEQTRSESLISNLSNR